MIAHKKIRCAVYTRKSLDEGLEKDLNSLTVQREAAEAYIASQSGEGWECLSTQYDDGGFSGGNVSRPALKRLLDDIEAGLVDCVVVYKVDRLSRSLMDFARLSEVFEKHGVAFVSVTQQINTGTSMGKLMLGILISFAQFERETIAERTRDRMASARRKGRWVGGRPFLGYDIAPGGRELVVNEVEAGLVRKIFQLFLEYESLSRTRKILLERDVRMKRWVTRSGRETGGSLISKSGLHGLLCNVAYIGKVSYKGEVIDGAHDGIVDEAVFESAQALLKRNDRCRTRVRNKHHALLRGILKCRHCGCAMTHTWTKKKSGSKAFRYYVCQRAIRESWTVCPTKSVAAGEIESFVVKRISALGTDKALQMEVVKRMQAAREKLLMDLRSDAKRLNRDAGRIQKAVHRAAGEKATAACFELLQEQSDANELALAEVNEKLAQLNGQEIDPGEIAHALSLFHPVWQNLTTLERCDLIGSMVDRIEYDGEAGELEIIWNDSGFEALLEGQKG
jgi:site-specific DNA recombinase